VILPDTSIWIDFFKKTSAVVDERMQEYLTTRQVCALSAIFGELLQGVRDDREEKVIIEYWKNLPQVEERNLFIDAGKLSYEHRFISKGVGLIDCYILAAARRYQLELWTNDKKLFQAYKLLQ
jgi:predicted nucleic acid-binding protein